MSPENLFNAIFWEHQSNFVSKDYLIIKLEVMQKYV